MWTYSKCWNMSQPYGGSKVINMKVWFRAYMRFLSAESWFQREKVSSNAYTSESHETILLTYCVQVSTLNFLPSKAFTIFKQPPFIFYQHLTTLTYSRGVKGRTSSYFNISQQIYKTSEGGEFQTEIVQILWRNTIPPSPFIMRVTSRRIAS